MNSHGPATAVLLNSTRPFIALMRTGSISENGCMSWDSISAGQCSSQVSRVYLKQIIAQEIHEQYELKNRKLAAAVAFARLCISETAGCANTTYRSENCLSGRSCACRTFQLFRVYRGRTSEKISQGHLTSRIGMLRRDAQLCGFDGLVWDAPQAADQPELG
jgi:hypothetical protein